MSSNLLKIIQLLSSISDPGPSGPKAYMFYKTSHSLTKFLLHNIRTVSYLSQ